MQVRGLSDLKTWGWVPKPWVVSLGAVLVMTSLLSVFFTEARKSRKSRMQRCLEISKSHQGCDSDLDTYGFVAGCL